MKKFEQKTKLTLTNVEGFTDDLWTQINIFGLLNDTKTDICDYLLYLLNKHAKLDDNSNFLNQYSNEELSRMLKMSISKVKSTKKNIACKFMDDDEYSTIFVEFLKKISSDDYELDIENTNINLIIDYPVLKDILETKLKKLNRTFDYTLNSEKVNISIKAFFQMLKNECSDKEDLNVLETAIEKVRKEKSIILKKNIAGNIVDIGCEIMVAIKNPLEIGNATKSIIKSCVNAFKIYKELK